MGWSKERYNHKVAVAFTSFIASRGTEEKPVRIGVCPETIGGELRVGTKEGRRGRELRGSGSLERGLYVSR